MRSGDILYAWLAQRRRRHDRRSLQSWGARSRGSTDLADAGFGPHL